MEERAGDHGYPDDTAVETRPLREDPEVGQAERDFEAGDTDHVEGPAGEVESGVFVEVYRWTIGEVKS